MTRADVPVAIVTGASRGIGRHIAEHMTARGWCVAGCSRGATAFTHGNYVHYPVDVCDERAVCRMVSSVRKQWGRVDAAVNCAGTAAMNHALLTSAEAAVRMLHTNVLGTFLVSREAAKVMRIGGFGRLVGFGSVAVPLQVEGEALYAASKSAVNTLMAVLARELAPFGITCNTIAPSPVATEMIHNVPAAKIEGVLSRLAVKRMGSMDDITNVLDFLLRPESSAVTGQVIYMGGC